ncbi:MAG: ABC transporter permease [Burkholderiaceae bacterium]|jgi:cobalt/nickel transport system permease protein|nr:ABC transporter permease [Burkholderiaceae bacterium]
MSERIKLVAYLAAIVAASWLTSPVWLAGGLLVTLVLCGRAGPRLLRQAVLATAAFSGTISLAYAGYVWWSLHRLPLDWLITVNLRVLLMALLTFLFITRVNLFQALSFSRRLSFLLVLAVSQSLVLKRTLAEFRLGLESRSLRPASLSARYRAAAHAIAWLLDRALANAHESAQAMQSRGVFK